MRGGVFPLSPLPRLGEGRGQGEWGEGPNRPRRFRPTKAAVSNCRPPPSHPAPGRARRPWVETAQNARHWKLRASFAMPPGGGCDQPPQAVSPHEGRSFQLQAVTGPNALGRGRRPWVEAAQNARQLDVAGFVCQAPLRGLRLTAPDGFATEGRSFELPAASGPNAPRPRPPSVGGSRTERPATGSCGLRLPSPLAGGCD